MGLLSSVGDLFGGDKPSVDVEGALRPFNQQLKYVTDFSKSPVEQNKSALKAMEDVRRQRSLSASDLAAAGQGAFASRLDELAATGGVDSGTRALLARQSGRDIGEAQSDLYASSDRTLANISAQDYAQEEGERFNAMLAALQGSQFGADARIKGQLGNIGVQAQRDAGKKGLFSSLGGLAGAAIGYKLGGSPMGALLGMGIGKAAV